jgi:hypothetical protein
MVGWNRLGSVRAWTFCNKRVPDGHLNGFSGAMVSMSVIVNVSNVGSSHVYGGEVT